MTININCSIIGAVQKIGDQIPTINKAAGKAKGEAGGNVTFIMWGGAGEKATEEGYPAPFPAQNPDRTLEIITPPEIVILSSILFL